MQSLSSLGLNGSSYHYRCKRPQLLWGFKGQIPFSNFTGSQPTEDVGMMGRCRSPFGCQGWVLLPPLDCELLEGGDPVGGLRPSLAVAK